jgi:HPt (histidine-containing phosphotransfer) domain-containing protein
VNAIEPDVLGGLAAAMPRADLLEIIATFDADLRRLGGELRGAAAAGETLAYRRAAHALAGAAAGVGAKRLERVARLAMDPQGAEAPATIASLIRVEVEEACLELARLGAELPTAD